MIKTGYLKLSWEEAEKLSSILSLKKILQIQILALLIQIPDALIEPLSCEDIPLIPTVTDRDLSYRSAIAFKVRKKTSWEREIFAEQLFNALVNRPLDTEKITDLTIEVQLIDRVWLDFMLDFSSLQVWLIALSQKLNQLDCLATRSPTVGITETAIAADCQYAHARACALLRLAEQEKVFSSFDLFSTEPLTALNLSNSARSLLEQILRIIDQQSGKTPENWLKVGKKLSQSFLLFERHDRLFDSKNHSKNQFAWLLLINTRAMLQIILLTKLEIPAPDQL